MGEMPVAESFQPEKALIRVADSGLREGLNESEKEAREAEEEKRIKALQTLRGRLKTIEQMTSTKADELATALKSGDMSQVASITKVIETLAAQSKKVEQEFLEEADPTGDRAN